MAISGVDFPVPIPVAEAFSSDDKAPMFQGWLSFLLEMASIIMLRSLLRLPKVSVNVCSMSCGDEILSVANLIPDRFCFEALIWEVRDMIV